MILIRLISFTTGVGLCLAGCSDETELSVSNLSFSHAQGVESAGGPLGFLEAIDRGWTKQTSAAICLQPIKSDEYSVRQQQLELQLAYATWLQAAGRDQASWQRFHFFSRDFCDQESVNHDFAIIYPQGSAEQLRNPSDGRSSFRFVPKKLRCEKIKVNSISCSSLSPFILGWARTGKVIFHTDKLESIKFDLVNRPEIYLSPFTKWLPLSAIFRKAAEPHLLDDRSKSLIYNYESLLKMDPRDRSFVTLVALTEQLRSHELIGSDDPIEDAFTLKFMTNDEQYSEITLIPQWLAFPTLLHEVGHQFGMLHAHSPKNVSGRAKDPDTRYRQRGNHWSTDDACMAYGKEFTFLTADDRAGQQSNAASVKQYFDEQVLHKN